ncbi:NAD(P)/FAD-dependent oxidoreductase [Frigidibacter sp. ROC022]|uniref:NAD(P)/FAD-dependent oxidoreductase n=1 Tax=Frigidibacter sp. ROC022 TaxID=2971796 RepID=UPI00215B2B75|nr:FAD-binding oxidoreductase [Frigidibacter sp. ROC022]MCR8723768.1 FAD-binding oxidoreductase [Frigidibacter sp. ROC022]
MPANPPDSLWQRTTPESRSYPALDGAVSADVAIIGGGFTGVSAAYHLAVQGVSVVLLEAVTVGFGGSGRNVGLVNAGLWTPPDAVEEKLGQEVGAELNRALAAGPELVFDLIESQQINCEATRCGTLHCAHSAAGLRDLERRAAQQWARGAPVRLLDAEETARRTGSPAFHGALWDARAGTIQPLAYVQGLARAAAAQGARLHERSAVTGMVRDGDHWRLRTAGGEVRAARLIQATNAYGSDGVPANPVTLAHYFQLATAPLPRSLLRGILAGGEGCWDTALIMSSFRLDRAGRMIFGALGNLDGAGGRAHRGWARRKLAALFPQLAGVPFEQDWTGRIAMTSTYLPRVQALGEGAVSIFGYSGRGISPGTVFGRAAADWATGRGGFPVPVLPAGPGPRNPLKALYCETGAVLTHLADARLSRGGRAAPAG